MAKSRKKADGTLGPVTILGGGNVGQALARGLLAKAVPRGGHHIDTPPGRETRRAGEPGFGVSADNRAAIERARVVVIAVQPRQLDALLSEVRESSTRGVIR